MPRSHRNKRQKSSPLIPILIGFSFILFFLILYVVGSVVNQESQKLNADDTPKQEGPGYTIKYVKDTSKPKRIIVKQSKPAPPTKKVEIRKEVKQETKTEPPPITITKMSPEQKSKSHLLQIWDALKRYSDTHDGRLPIEVFQLSLTNNLLKSPRDNQDYIYVKELRGENFSAVQERVLFRETSATNGFYLCLYGNGTVLSVKE